MKLSDQYRAWINNPNRFEDQELSGEFSTIYEITKDKLQVHTEERAAYQVEGDKAMNIMLVTGQVKELFDYLFENHIPWQLQQSEEYMKKAFELRELLKTNSAILDTKFFQQNIGRQRLKVIQFWMDNLE